MRKGRPHDRRPRIESITEDRIIKESADGTQILVHDKRKIKLWNKLEALKLLAQHLKILAGLEEQKPPTLGGAIDGIFNDLERATRISFLIEVASKRMIEDTGKK